MNASFCFGAAPNFMSPYSHLTLPRNSRHHSPPTTGDVRQLERPPEQLGVRFSQQQPDLRHATSNQQRVRPATSDHESPDLRPNSPWQTCNSSLRDLRPKSSTSARGQKLLRAQTATRPSLAQLAAPTKVLTINF